MQYKKCSSSLSVLTIQPSSCSKATCACPQEHSGGPAEVGGTVLPGGAETGVQVSNSLPAPPGQSEWLIAGLIQVHVFIHIWTHVPYIIHVHVCIQRQPSKCSGMVMELPSRLLRLHTFILIDSFW